MYVHIGKDIVINSNNIVAILDIDSFVKNIKEGNNLNETLQNLKINDKIVDISDDNQKSLILLNKNIAYITNISSITLAKRASGRSYKEERQNRRKNNGKIRA